MRDTPNNWWAKQLSTVTNIIKSKHFFGVILILFLFESLWVALSAIYPMAFDEDFHFGIIKFYAHHLSPFIANQPPNTYIYGAITRDPSYFYQYLMSFPYRVISLLVKSVTGQIIALRLINIGIFASAIYVFKKLFGKFTNLSPLLINLVLLFFVLTPIVPQMAGQINYDSLFILSIAASLYLFLDFIKDLRSNGQLNIKKGFLLLATCLLASLVKYAFLPIFLALAVAAVIIIIRHFGSFKKIKLDIKTGLIKLTKAELVILSILTAVSLGLFIQRYGVNLVRYHNPVPNCNQVLTVSECRQFEPWNRNYQILMNKPGQTKPNIFSFTGYWFNHTLFGMTTVINGRNSNFNIGQPLPILKAIFLVTFIGGLAAIILFGRRVLWNNPINRILLFIVIFYLGSLWLYNFKEYSQLGQTVAIQGRYWIPALIPILILFGQIIAYLMQKYQSAKLIFVIAFTVLILQGGGIATFVIRSDDSWYWQNSVVAKINKKSRSVLHHVIIS